MEIDMATTRYSPAQQALLRSLHEAGETNTTETWFECLPDELRTARALAKRGLIVFCGEVDAGSSFEIRLTDSGIAAVLEVASSQKRAQRVERPGQ